MNVDLLQLPWLAQITIIGGYLAYVIAYSGRRVEHKTYDFAAIWMCFSAITWATYNLVILQLPVGLSNRNIVAGGISIFVAVGAGVIWRAKLHEIFQKMLRFLGADQDDGYSTAWLTVTQRPNIKYSQVYVTLKDGRKLESYMMDPFNDLPNGSCVFGRDGSIAMYVNAIEEVGEKRREITSISDADGHRITYIPASQIAEVDMRRSQALG